MEDIDRIPRIEIEGRGIVAQEQVPAVDRRADGEMAGHIFCIASPQQQRDTHGQGGR